MLFEQKNGEIIRGFANFAIALANKVIYTKKRK